MINVLADFCNKWGLKVNLSKTKIIVFRRGGKLKTNEKWFFCQNKIEVVKQYKYLGIIFTPKLKWTLAKKVLSSQARKALGLLYSYHYKCGHLPLNIAMNLFDKMIAPILLYGSEIWGFEYCEGIESVQTAFYKRILGLSTNASNSALMAELGLYPLAVTYYKRCIKYWLKIINMPDNRLPKACYDMLKHLDDHGRKTWATSVKMLLIKFGFKYVWESQGVTNDDTFLETFESRVKEHFKAEILRSIQNSSKLAVYSTFKDEFMYEPYLDILDIQKHLKSLIKFRCSDHNLEIEQGRYSQKDLSERICNYCKERFNWYVIEDEFHVLFHCEKYTNLRLKYLNPIIFGKSYDSFVKIMKSDDPNNIKTLACLIYHILNEDKIAVPY